MLTRIVLCSLLSFYAGTAAAATNLPSIPRDLSELEQNKREERARMEERIATAKTQLEELEGRARQRKSQSIQRDEAALRFIDSLLERVADLRERPENWAEIVRKPVGIERAEYLALLNHSLEMPEVQRVLRGLGPLTVEVTTDGDPAFAEFLRDSLVARGAKVGFVGKGAPGAKGTLECTLRVSEVETDFKLHFIKTARATALVRVLAADGTPRHTFNATRGANNVSLQTATTKSVDDLAYRVLADWAKLVLDRAAKVDGGI